MSAIEWGVLVFKNGVYQPQVSGLATELSFGKHNYNDLEPNAVTLYIDRNYLRVGFLGYEKYKFFIMPRSFMKKITRQNMIQQLFIKVQDLK